MTATASPSRPKKLTAEQARLIAGAENRVEKLSAQLEVAKEERDELRDRYAARINQPSTDPDDADKDVKVARAGGWEIRVTTFTGGESFSLKKYRELGHKITAAMRDAISPGREQKRWTVKRLEGPYKPGSVEPA